jgi:hypothetical protein
LKKNFETNTGSNYYGFEEYEKIDERIKSPSNLPDIMKSKNGRPDSASS